MSYDDGKPHLPRERAEAALADDRVRDLVRDALAEPPAVPDLTRGVQKKLRLRSGGKFYADGWSTAKHAPVTTYLISSLIMLFVLCVIFALLAPLSGAPERAPPPKPVNVILQR